MTDLLVRPRVAHGLAALVVVALFAGTPAQAQRRCSVSVERTASALEYRPVPYGGEVDIRPLFVVDCGAARATRLTVTEHLPGDVEVVPGIGTPPDNVVGRDLTWSRDVSGVGRTDPITFTYRVYVLPDVRRLAVSPTVEIDWPMDIEVAIGPSSERHPGPDPDPLVVQARPGARGCQRFFDHRVEPPVVDAGEPFTVDLQLRTERCSLPGLRHHAVVAVQPPRDALERAGLVDAVAALLAEVDERDPGQRGAVGLYVNHPTAADKVAPTVDRAALLARLGAAPLDPAGGADGASAIGAALAMVPDWADHHEVLYYVANASAPRADGTRLREVIAAAAAQGAEIVPMCVGGACDPGLTWRYAEVDLARLRRTIALWEIPRRHGGATIESRRVEVDEALQDYVTLHDGSTRPPAAEQAGRIRWTDLTIPPDGAIHLTYRAQIDDWGRFPVGASGVVRHQDDSGRARADDLLLPAFVTVRRPADNAGDPCRVELEKRADPVSLPLGDSTMVSLSFRPRCQTLVERMNVVLSLDRSGSMAYGDTEFAYVKFAARALAEMLAVENTSERRFGLISHGDPPVIELPLGNDPDVIAARIEAMVARGQDNLARSIDDGARMLRDARPPAGERPAEVLVVLSDGGQTYPAASALPAAQAARSDGITVVAACARTADAHCDIVRQLASTPESAFEVAPVDRVLAAFVDLGMRLRQVPLREATITDDLPAHVWYVPDSASPPATVSGRRITWRIDALASLGTRVMYRALPLLSGTQPTNSWADVRFADVLGRTGHAVFTVPAVTTYTRPTSGPCSAVVAHRVAAPEGAQVDRPVTLNITARTSCPRIERAIDVVLVVDCSSTMRNYGRLANTKQAIGELLDTLDPRVSRAGLIGFTDEIVARVPLTDDLPTVRARAGELRASGGTDIAPALEAARELLSEGGWIPGGTRGDALVVLLTDGLTQGSASAMQLVADTMKAEGVTIATVCAGSCDAVLPRLASRPDLAFSVVDSALLVPLYRELLRTVRADYAHDVEIVNTLSPLVDPLATSFAPVPDGFAWAGAGEAARAVWRVAEVTATGVTLRYDVVPRAPGRIPVALAEMTYRYGQDGIRHRVVLPVPVVEVTGGVPATPTPLITTAPTRTRIPTPIEPPSATPTTDAPRVLRYLPAVVR